MLRRLRGLSSERVYLAVPSNCTITALPEVSARAVGTVHSGSLLLLRLLHSCQGRRVRISEVIPLDHLIRLFLSPVDCNFLQGCADLK